jgi:hypothetical protein
LALILDEINRLKVPLIASSQESSLRRKTRLAIFNWAFLWQSQNSSAG